MKYFLNILLLFIVGFGFAQNQTNFSLVASKNKLLIGEPVQVSLLFQYSTDIDPSKIGFPVISDSTALGEAVEIWDIRPPKERSSRDNIGDIQMYFEQDFTITSFDSGMVEIGPISALVGDDSVHSNVISILFLPVVVDTTLDFKDIKALVEDPFTNWENFKMWFENNWPWVTAIIVAILATLIIIRKRRRKPEKVVSAPQIPLPTTLLEKLQSIEQEELWQNNKHKLYYSKLTDIIWQYIEYRYGIPTFEKTSNEILSKLKLKAISEDHHILISKLFILADMVKFAKTLPSPQENEEAIIIVRKTIQDTRNDLKKKPEKNQN
jgi:hypothetical protein